MLGHTGDSWLVVAILTDMLLDVLRVEYSRPLLPVYHLNTLWIRALAGSGRRE
jgi:hypothetical protein